MAKKLGKILLFTAAVGSAVAAVYYYMQKKEAAKNVSEDEDFDDFCDDSDEESECSRSYVSLKPDASAGKSAEAKDSQDTTQCPCEQESSFTPLTEQVAQAAKNTEETVEEFFSEDDSTDNDSGRRQ